MARKGASTIILIRKKPRVQHGHHGGAWKVAYADFMTAMMALFIVLWLMSSNEKIKKAVAGYFNDPKGTATMLGTQMTGNGDAILPQPPNNIEKLMEKLQQDIRNNPELRKLEKQIALTITPEGLRIELLESKNGTFFESGSAQLSPDGQETLALLASELKNWPNSLLIEGHTDAQPYSESAYYTNWELSADRANAARRLLQQDGVRKDQVTQVRGYSDQMLRVKNNPFDPTNRRISLLVRNLEALPHPLKGGVLVDVPPHPVTPAAPAPAPAPLQAQMVNKGAMNTPQSTPSSKVADTVSDLERRLQQAMNSVKKKK